MFITKTFVGWVLLLFLTTPQGLKRDVHGENENRVEVPTGRVIRTSGQYPTISVDVQVLSATTRAVVENLSRNNFSISENGVRQNIFAWWRTPSPLSLVIAIDGADVTTDSQILENRVNALKSSFTNRLEPEDEVKIIAITDRPVVLQDYTSNKQLINVALERVSQQKVRSRLRARDSLEELIQEAASSQRDLRNPRARRAVIVISGLPEKLADKLVLPEDIVKAVVDSETIFCWDGFARLTSPHSSESRHSLGNVTSTELVGLSGGEFVNGDWKSFLERLRRRYRIVYLPFTSQREGQIVKKFEVEVKPSTSQNAHDLLLSYQQFAIIPFSKR